MIDKAHQDEDDVMDIGGFLHQCNTIHHDIDINTLHHGLCYAFGSPTTE